MTTHYRLLQAGPHLNTPPDYYVPSSTAHLFSMLTDSDGDYLKFWDEPNRGWGSSTGNLAEAISNSYTSNEMYSGASYYQHGVRLNSNDNIYPCTLTSTGANYITSAAMRLESWYYDYPDYYENGFIEGRSFDFRIMGVAGTAWVGFNIYYDVSSSSVKIRAQKYYSGSTTTFTTATYSTTNHRHLKIAYTGINQWTFYTSSNRSSWSVFYSNASAAVSQADRAIYLAAPNTADDADAYDAAPQFIATDFEILVDERQYGPVSTASMGITHKIAYHVNLTAQAVASAILLDPYRLTEKFQSLTAGVSATASIVTTAFKSVALTATSTMTPTMQKSHNGPRMTISGGAVEPGKIALPVRITHGRSDIGNQPDAPQLTFTYLGNVAPADHGAVVCFYVDEQMRFKGRITKLVAVERFGLVWGYSVECVGDQAILGTTKVTLTRSSESDVARVSAIGTAAGVTINIVGDTGGEVTLRPDNIDTDALAAIHEVCKTSGGLFWQGTDGDFYYGTMSHRDTDPVGMLPPHLIMDGLSWTNDVSTVVNHVTVKYTTYPNWPSVDGAVNYEDTYQDTTSINTHGKRHVDVDTLGYNSTEAGVVGLMILAARKNPRWRMPGVMAIMDRCSVAEQEFVNSLDVSTRIFAPIENAPFDIPGNVEKWVVEGFVEEWAGGAKHSLQLALSEPGATLIALTWDDTDAHTYSYWSGGSYLQMMKGIA